MQSLFLRASILLALWLMTGIATAQLRIPAGGSLRLGGGQIALAGTAASVQGRLELGGGQLLDTGAFDLAAGGVLQLGLGRLQLAGNWSNAGTFDAGQGVVEFIDGRQPVSARILGSNRFFDLVITSSVGKRYLLQTRQTQFVAGLLRLLGVGPALQIDVTQGPIAAIALAASGTQDIANVGVSDVHATAQHLAPGQTNQGGRGNDFGWFGQFNATQIPASSALTTLLLLGALALAGLFRLPGGSNTRQRGST